MTGLELTDRLTSDIERSIAIKGTDYTTKDDILQSVDTHLNLIAQLINLDGEQLINHQAGETIDLSRFLADIIAHKEKIILRIEHFINEDPFVTLPDNQSIAGELIAQLNILHTDIH